MQDYPETLWNQAKQAYKVPEGVEPLAKLLFLQGMYSGHQLGLQSTKMPDRTCIQFNTDLLAQIKARLAELGHRPAHINLSTGKIINGEG